MNLQTVYEAAEQRIRQNSQKIKELQDENAAAKVRLQTPAFANMYEAERLAAQVEPFLPTIDSLQQGTV